MRIFLTIAIGCLLGGCTTLPPEVFRQSSSVPGTAGESVTGDLIDFTNEATPETTDSLEILPPETVVIPVRVTEAASLILGDAGSGTVRSRNPPTLRVFLDYGCEFCREEALTLRPWIVQSYVSTHRLNLELVYMPQTPQGELLATAAVCAAKYNVFSDMEKTILLHPQSTSAALQKEASALGITSALWKKCMSSITFAAEQNAPDGTIIERLPALTMGEDFWIGVETKAVLQEKIDAYLQAM